MTDAIKRRGIVANSFAGVSVATGGLLGFLSAALSVGNDARKWAQLKSMGGQILTDYQAAHETRKKTISRDLHPGADHLALGRAEAFIDEMGVATTELRELTRLFR